MGDVILKPGGAGADSDELTANKDDVLKGKTAVTHDSDGEPVAGTLELTGNITAADIRVGKTGYSTNPKSKITGTQTDRGAWNGSVDMNGSVTVPAGIHNGLGKVTGPAIANRGAVTSALNCGGSYTIPSGYHNGSGRVTANSLASQTSASATTSDVLTGKTAYVNGAKITGNIPARASGGTHGNGLGWNTNGLYYYIPYGNYPQEGSSGKSWVYMTRAEIGTLVTSVVSFSVAQYANLTLIASWAKPSKGPWSGVRIMCKQGSYPSSASDGTLFYEGSGTSATKSLAAGTWYFRGWNYVTAKDGQRIYNQNYIQTSASNVAIKGQQNFTSSGTFTVPAKVYSIDIFVVGGGGGGASPYDKHAGGGGGGGYTTNISIAVSPGQQFAVKVGAGADSETDGSASSFGSYSAGGGKIPSTYDTYFGGDGGSGGGAGSPASNSNWKNGGDGGFDGGNGGSNENGSWRGGYGQGSTTKAFGTGEIFSGGGGGGSKRPNYTSGGTGGGGHGGGYPDGYYAGSGAANTGGGGGGTGYDYTGKGGSGIVMVRWGY